MDTQINELQAITNLQRYLRRINFDRGGNNTVPIDGIFDTATRDAVMNFQKQSGFPVTGIADKQTWDAIYGEYRRLTRNQRELEGLYIFPQTPENYSVSLGDTLTLVRIIQLLLLELRSAYDIFEDVTESGTFDINTQNAIKEFQRINGFEETGEVDERTWNRIVREYANLEKRE